MVLLVDFFIEEETEIPKKYYYATWSRKNLTADITSCSAAEKTDSKTVRNVTEINKLKTSRKNPVMNWMNNITLQQVW